ncbi:MAG: DNA-3-methyladenine glycosylase I [Alphaproteobacteria bacterium]|nr:DNA-3-methyladenine glycosylase I [Alphaproteobacteria bacterium]
MSRAYCESAPLNPVQAVYHNTEYGFPTSDERVLFERLCLEIMQAGLSWEIVMKKRVALNKAFDGFRPAKIAAYDQHDIDRLLSDAGIIRNRLKIKAIIANAQTVLDLRKTHGGFAAWLAAHHPQNKPQWVKLFRNTFAFTGGEITGEFLMSIGYLPGAHWRGCPVYKKLCGA